ncbi:SGNH/GDSL hydrolase family protein [Foetidibacter luteolus]|uniref:SGNH/GDSL hydrolase family protein n=1 Tax=Foetidibacter luteolus TaxID=2608880 RepID=UPI00129AC810|nr:hypothetical protein [Foetidibacter luteolus]
MRKALALLLATVLSFHVYSQSDSTSIEVVNDTVKVVNGEFVVTNATKNTSGYLYNQGNGITRFKSLEGITKANVVQFRIGEDTINFPDLGDSIYINAAFIDRQVKVWRNGVFQYRDSIDGILYDTLTGSLLFKPAFKYGEKISIEAAEMDLLQHENFGFYTNRNSLQLAASEVLGHKFSLVWGTSSKTLTESPVVVGIGGSTLYGQGLSFPDRLGDKINAWLQENTVSPSWINLAQNNFRSSDIHTVASGGNPNYNIDKALSYKPDIIFIALPGQDVADNIPLSTTLQNLREIDNLCKAKGAVAFLQTAQPRSVFSDANEQKLEVMADSIRQAWPDRYVEAFTDIKDYSTSRPASLLPAYSQADSSNLSGAGNQPVANRLFERWQNYFQATVGVSSFSIQTKTDQTDWVAFNYITDPDILKKTFSKPDIRKRHYRIRADFKNGQSSPYSNTVTIDSTIITTSSVRVLIDLGGDSLYTQGPTGLDGKPTPSPDGQGKYWNNWYGTGGVTGFTNGAFLGNLRSTNNTNTGMAVKLIGTPTGTFNSGTTKGINYTGFKTGAFDYPMQALYDNMFGHSSTSPNGVTLRLTGLNSSKAYKVKLWGARLDNTATARVLQAKLGDKDWNSALTVDTKYPTAAVPDYDRAILFDYIADKDSVDINLRVAPGSTYWHVGVIDIDTVPYVPSLLPLVKFTPLNITLSNDSSYQLTPIITANGSTISTYQWTQVSGPSTTTFATPTQASTFVNKLTNGIYTYKITVTTVNGEEVNATASLLVSPNDNGKKTMRVHFSSARQDAIPGWMNAYGSPHTDTAGFTDPITGWRLHSVATGLWTPYNGYSSYDGSGKTTGNNSGVVPDLALKNYWFSSNTAFSGPYNLVISGLDTSKTYKINLVGSRNTNTGAPKYSCFNIKDSNGDNQVYLQNAFGNTGQYTASPALPTALTPDANGKIYIGVYAPSNTATYGPFSYLNALVLQEN